MYTQRPIPSTKLQLDIHRHDGPVHQKRAIYEGLASRRHFVEEELSPGTAISFRPTLRPGGPAGGRPGCARSSGGRFATSAVQPPRELSFSRSGPNATVADSCAQHPLKGGWGPSSSSIARTAKWAGSSTNRRALLQLSNSIHEKSDRRRLSGAPNRSRAAPPCTATCAAVSARISHSG